LRFGALMKIIYHIFLRLKLPGEACGTGAVWISRSAFGRGGRDGWAAIGLFD